MMASPPPGTPYHRLARTDAHRWWRPLVGTVFVFIGGGGLGLALYIAALTAAAIAGGPTGPEGLPVLGELPETATLFLSIAVLLPMAMVAARWIQRRPPGTLSSVTGRLRWRWLWTCAPVAVAAVVLLIGMLAAVEGVSAGVPDAAWVGWGRFALSTAVMLLVVPLQAAAEEYAFRGWLLQAFGSVLRRPWVPIAVQAVLFAALHGMGTPWGFVDLVVFGVLAGWLTVRTGGIEAAVALHVANNLAAVVIAAALGQLSVEESAADMGWRTMAVDVPVLVAYTLTILWLARRRGLLTHSPGPQPTPVAPGVLVTAGHVPAERGHPAPGGLPGSMPESAAGQVLSYSACAPSGMPRDIPTGVVRGNERTEDPYGRRQRPAPDPL